MAIPFRVSSAFMSPYESPAKGAKAVCPMDDALGSKALWSQLESFAKRKEGDELVVGVTGVTNVSRVHWCLYRHSFAPGLILYPVWQISDDKFPIRC